jgi:hypothetical protein
MRVVFNDGEIIRGISLGYSEDKRGFFLLPVDPECNNDRIFIVSEACKDIKVGFPALPADPSSIRRTRHP